MWSFFCHSSRQCSDNGRRTTDEGWKKSATRGSNYSVLSSRTFPTSTGSQISRTSAVQEAAAARNVIDIFVKHRRRWDVGRCDTRGSVCMQLRLSGNVSSARCSVLRSSDDQRPAAASARMFKGSHQSSRGAVNWPAGRNVNVAFAALLLGRSVGKVQVNMDFYSTSQMFRIIGVQTVSQHPPKTHAMHALQKKRDVNEKLPLLVVIIIIVIIIICQHLIHSWRCNSTWLILC